MTINESVERAAREARPDLWEIPAMYEALGWPEQEREKVRKIVRIARAIAYRDAADVCDDTPAWTEARECATRLRSLADQIEGAKP